MRLIAASSLILLLAIGCNKDKPQGGGTATGSAGSAGSAATGSAGSAAAADPGGGALDIDSKDVLARTEVARESYVQHVLISWRDREAFYTASSGRIDPRAKERDQAAAAKLAQEVLAQLRAKPDSIGELIDKHSEDPLSRTGDPFRIEPGSGFPPGFVKLALRLKEGEAGIVTTDFGYHVTLRGPKPVPDPLASADILKREEETPPIYWQHIAIGWDQRPANTDPRAKARTKEAADTLAKELLAKARAKGADMAKLMKQYSEDPASKDNGRIEKTLDTSTDPAERLALRLKIDEVGMIRTALGWDIIKRVPPPPPPPPDKLESIAILKRKPETAMAKVKHILVGWADLNAGDDRAKTRTRAQLDKLVPEIIDRAKKGEPFESLMIAFSEDAPAAVRSGKAYDVTPDAPLAMPFVNLSLRLKVDEIGVVRTDFGLHIIKRVE
ncbi:MAG TPA: peptidylprolyl isomerase [Kofleriaceae bacterium]|nr:peptidylprolyl isomerase [Kofleriaceae bacterium]